MPVGFLRIVFLSCIVSYWDNIEMDLREAGWDGVNWIDRAQDSDQWRALVNMVLNLRVP
jgi:hypothetical protein